MTESDHILGTINMALAGTVAQKKRLDTLQDSNPIDLSELKIVCAHLELILVQLIEVRKISMKSTQIDAGIY